MRFESQKSTRMGGGAVLFLMLAFHIHVFLLRRFLFVLFSYLCKCCVVAVVVLELEVCGVWLTEHSHGIWVVSKQHCIPSPPLPLALILLLLTATISIWFEWSGFTAILPHVGMFLSLYMTC